MYYGYTLFSCVTKLITTFELLNFYSFWKRLGFLGVRVPLKVWKLGFCLCLRLHLLCCYYCHTPRRMNNNIRIRKSFSYLIKRKGRPQSRGRGHLTITDFSVLLLENIYAILREGVVEVKATEGPMTCNCSLPVAGVEIEGQGLGLGFPSLSQLCNWDSVSQRNVACDTRNCCCCC